MEEEVTEVEAAVGLLGEFFLVEFEDGGSVELLGQGWFGLQILEEVNYPRLPLLERQV